MSGQNLRIGQTVRVDAAGESSKSWSGIEPLCFGRWPEMAARCGRNH